jgi:hypothetical protein
MGFDGLGRVPLFIGVKSAFSIDIASKIECAGVGIASIEGAMIIEVAMFVGAWNALG